MTVGQYYWLIKALDTGMDWPWQYSFPPFFTIQVSNHVLINLILSLIPDDCSSLLQPHSATRAKQLEAWRHLVLNYCQVIISGQYLFTAGAVKTCTNCCVGEHNICPGSGRRRRLASLPQQLHIKKITCGSNTHSPWRSCPTVSEIIHVRAIIWSIFQWEPGMDGQEQTPRSHILEISGAAWPRDIQVSFRWSLLTLLQILHYLYFTTRWVSDSGQKGAVVTLVELEEEGEANSWRGVSQEVMLIRSWFETPFWPNLHIR